MDRNTFRKQYGIVRAAFKTPTVYSPALAEVGHMGDILSKLLDVWHNRIHRVSGGECYAADTPRNGFTRKDSIQVCLRAARYRHDQRRYGRPTGYYDRAPIPA